MTLCLYLRGRPSKEWNAKHPFSLITRYSVKEKTGLWPAFWMRIKQIPHTKNKLTGKQSKITKYYGTQLDKLTSEQNKITKCYGTQLDYVINIYTYIYITKGDKIYWGDVKGWSRHIVHNVTKLPLLKQMAIYGRQDLWPGFCSFPRVTASQHSAHHKLPLFTRHILNIGILNDLNM